VGFRARIKNAPVILSVQDVKEKGEGGRRGGGGAS